MKTIAVLICAVVAGVLTQGHDHAHDHSHEHIDPDLQEIHDKCQADPASYIDESRFENIADHVDDPQVGRHFLCESVLSGLQTEDGKLIIDAIRAKIARSISDKDQVEKLIKKCAIQKDDAGKTAILLWMCFSDNGVEYFHEF